MEGPAEAKPGDTKHAAEEMEVAPANLPYSGLTAHIESNGVEHRAVGFESPDPSSVGETIDDIVNELRSSGVELPLDDSMNPSFAKPAVKSEEGQHDAVAGNDASYESPPEGASVATTVSLHSPVSSEGAENLPKDSFSDEVVVLSPADSDGATLEEQQHIQSNSESARMEGDDDAHETKTNKEGTAAEPQEVNGKADDVGNDTAEDGEASKGSDAQQAQDIHDGDDDDMDEPLSSFKHKDSKDEKHASQGKGRRRTTLKVSMAGMLHKKIPESSANVEDKRHLEGGSKRRVELRDENGEGSSGEESVIQIAKRSRNETEDLTGRCASSDEPPGNSKLEAPKEQGQGSKKKNPKHKSVLKKNIRQGAEEAGSMSVRSDESETSEACPWSLEEFVASDGYLKDVIGRSLGSTNGRFLTIELPEVDTVKRRRAWHMPSARRSRPVVYGGCDPTKVYIMVMGVKVPISCWSQICKITPNVLVTDIFEDMVRWKSDAAK